MSDDKTALQQWCDIEGKVLQESLVNGVQRLLEEQEAEQLKQLAARFMATWKELADVHREE